MNMNRATRTFLGAVLGAVVAVVAFTMFLTVKYPNNPRDSGLPNFAVAIILASPVGAVVGAVLGALIPKR